MLEVILFLYSNAFEHSLLKTAKNKDSKFSDFPVLYFVVKISVLNFNSYEKSFNLIH